MKKIVGYIFVLLCFSANLYSQTTNDAGLWASVNVDKKLNSKFFLFFTEEYRVRENFSRTNLFYTDLGFGIKPVSFLKVSLAYRLIEKNVKRNYFSYRHRIMLDITLKKKYGKFGLSFRERIQVENRDIYSSDIGKLPEWYSRNKFKVDYDINKPITPWVAVELRYQIVNPRAVESNRQWSRNRYFVGLDYKRSEKHTFGVYYMIQQEYDISAPQDLYILGIDYSFSF